MKKSLFAASLAVFVSLGLLACGSSSSTAIDASASRDMDAPANRDTATTSYQPLRVAAAKANFHWGAAVNPDVLVDDPAYAKALAENFTVFTPEDVLKFEVVQPKQGVYDFTKGDQLADFARAHGMKMRGHTLVWHAQLPDWVKSGNFSRDELIAIMRDHIFTVMGHYRDKYPDVFFQWDVVNEAYMGSGARRQSVWQKGIGDDYIELAFKFAHEAWPDMQLYYNDYEEMGGVLVGSVFDPAELGINPQLAYAGPGATAGYSNCDQIPKCLAIKTMATDFKQRAIPLQGIGFQAHISNAVSPDYAQLTNWVEGLGLQWALTELDMPCASDQLDALNQALCFDNQARAFGAAVQACLDSPACDTVVQWGVSDRYTWWSGLTYDQLVNPLALDKDYQYKPAANAVLKALTAQAVGR
ncbi:MAG: endo-1,4-beta-xylanase [Pseudomonadota bacterium]